MANFRFSILDWGVGRIVAEDSAILAVCLDLVELIEADNGDLWRIMAADSMDLVLNL